MKWEYCAVVGISRKIGLGGQRDFHPDYPAIWLFTNNGFTKQAIPGDDAQKVARTIAMLGDDGWEMVGIGNITGSGNDQSSALYFKRPKP